MNKASWPFLGVDSTIVTTARVTCSGGGDMIGSRRGTYSLILSCRTNPIIQVGRLGGLQLQPGFYVYVGSALGPGGIAARVAHHERVSPRPRWHIDYLRAHTQLGQVWYTCDPVRREHQWADVFKQARGASIPMVGFGSSDCNCMSHLFRFETRPSPGSFWRRLGTTGMPPVKRLVIT